jgi:TM2 domain-containing membrane protein YozV
MRPAEILCPACREPVFIRATICPHCQYAFPPPERAATSAAVPPLYPVPQRTEPAPPPVPVAPPGYLPQPQAYVVPPARRSRSTAILWALFLGGVGAHKFYLGRPGWGLTYLLLFCTGVPALVGFCELVLMLFMSDAEFDRRHNTYYLQT